jgi:NTE family protein
MVNLFGIIDSRSLETGGGVNMVGSKVKIGLALGGGAARGLSHIGVLKVLDEQGIYPDVIAGTSIGAMVGALYAYGYKASEIEQLVLGMDWKKLVYLADITMSFNSLFKGKRVISLLKSILGDLTFSQLKCDFACVATDIINGEQVVLHNGSLVEAVRASISLPGIFTPVEVEGRYLVDGGLVNTVPVSVCRQMGAGYVIGVNVIPHPVRVMCNPKKDPKYQVCELVKPGDAGDYPDLSAVPRIDGHSLQSHIDVIENATKTFLTSRHPKQGTKIAELPSSPLTNKARRLRRKTPGLIEVLSQTLTIAEYQIAMENLKDADVAISPAVEEIGFWQFSGAAQAIAAGEAAARSALDMNKLVSLSR